MLVTEASGIIFLPLTLDLEILWFKCYLQNKAVSEEWL